MPPNRSTGGAPPADRASRNAPLRVYTAHYESLRSRLRDPGLSDRTLLYSVHEAAAFASGHHPGRFADGAIENIALDIGADLSDGDVSPAAAVTLDVTRGSASRRVLHVASTVLPVGGLTRMINHWIRHDASSCHSLVLTDQRKLSVPQWLVGGVKESGGGFASMPVSMGLLARTQCLRKLARSWADVVVLHVDSADLVPILAFAAKGTPPVCTLNHADHIFWLGSSIADMVIDLRDVSTPISAQRRHARCSTVLPIPLAVPPPQLSRSAARESVGIPQDQLMLLSVGRAVKYRPTLERDFFSTMRKVLTEVPAAHLYSVGITEAEAAQHGLGAHHDRIHLCGSIEDPSAYRAAADIYLEPFPFGSATALLEATLAGLPVVLPYAPLADVLVTNHGLEWLLSHAADEVEYVNRIRLLAQAPANRAALGTALRKHVRSHHTGKHWLDHLNAVYDKVMGLRHEPEAVPVTDAEETPLDWAVSSWQAESRAQPDVTRECRETMRTVCANYARKLRDAGNHYEAISLLSRGAARWGCDRQMALSMAKVPIHLVGTLGKKSN